MPHHLFDLYVWYVIWWYCCGNLDCLCTLMPNRKVETKLEETKSSFNWRQRGEHSRLVPQGLCPNLEGVVRSLRVFEEQGVISLWTFSWLVGGKVTRSQRHQPSGSSESGVHVLVGSTVAQLSSSTWWGLQHLQNSFSDIAQNTIYSFWRTESPWLCWMAELLLLFYFFLCIFFHLSD